MKRSRSANEAAPAKGPARRAPTPVVQPALFRDQVCDFIRADVKSGSIPPGQRLREVELAARYRVSRTPVREALIQLARDGVVRYAGPGYFAPSATPRALAETLEVKRLIEPAAAALAAEAAPARGLRLLQQCVLQSQCAHKTKRAPAFARAEERFHAVLREMCPNQSLVRCLVLSDVGFAPVRLGLLQHEAYRAASLKCQEEVLRACRARDGARARRALTRLLDEIAPGRMHSDAPAAGVDGAHSAAAKQGRKQAYGSSHARHEGSAQTSAAGGG